MILRQWPGAVDVDQGRDAADGQAWGGSERTRSTCDRDVLWKAKTRAAVVVRIILPVYRSARLVLGSAGYRRRTPCKCSCNSGQVRSRMNARALIAAQHGTCR